MSTKLQALADAIRNCQICAQHLAHEPRPIVQLGDQASVLIAGQAPGSRVQESGVPFDDPSGDRLRLWMGIAAETFYNTDQIAIAPMGFCYPGHGTSGDLPPRLECAPAWRQQVLNAMPNIRLTLAIGNYAIKWHLAGTQKRNLTETVRAWKQYAPNILPLPHPSPRNNIWLRKNPWFELEVLPELRSSVRNALTEPRL